MFFFVFVVVFVVVEFTPLSLPGTATPGNLGYDDSMLTLDSMLRQTHFQDLLHKIHVNVILPFPPRYFKSTFL
jgi:hypothetical protein